MDDIIRPKKRPSLQIDRQLAATNRPAVPTAPLVPSAPIRKPKKPSLDNEPAFLPPEQVADEEIIAAAQAPVSSDEPALLKKRRRFRPHMPHGKKQWIITILVFLLLLGGGGAALYWFVLRDEPAPVTNAQSTKKEEPAPEPTTETSKLSGREVPIGTNQIPVTAVMIENSPEARPQSGLKDASIIFEAIAEGGITRFSALFQDTAPDYVGPIRSVRPYYLDWIWPFDASIAHVGGAPQALADIKSLKIKDLDQFANGNSYTRITSRYAPHNVYTSIAKLRELQKTKGYTSADFTGFARKKEAKAATPTASTVDLSISGFYYNVHYVYDLSTNTYLRSEGGELHTDEKSGKQLAPNVVVAIVMNRGIASDGQHTDYTTVGSGHMYVFQDGLVQEGTWKKASRQAQWTFVAADGSEIAFNPGQTWFTMVDNNGSVTYAP